MKAAVQLPEQAQTKLVQLTGEAADCEDAVRAATDRLNQLQRDADPKVVERLQQRRADQSRKHSELMGLINAVKAWLNHLPAGTTLEPVEPVSVELAEGEKVLAVIQRTRDSISALQSRLSNVSTAPPPKSVLKKQAAELVAERAKRGAPNREIGSRGFKADWPNGDFLTKKDVADMFAYYLPDAVTKRDEQWIDETPTRSDALSAEERERRSAELSSQIETLERSEESLIQQAASDGIEIARREDADPRAVLGVQVQRRAAQAVA
jgi:hypothetical protein